MLDDKNKGVFKSPTLFSVTFKDANKFGVQNPVIGNLLSQVNANQLTDKQVKNILGEGEDLKIRARLDPLLVVMMMMMMKMAVKEVVVAVVA